ncbi:PqqD family peptide modification chaperone [Saccharothrix deserti]|uniref:PqqD family peptide modification chaperone n=1 Tax=Saccharothrix deserti TaxID=2593674 RepID=UPI00131D3401|nr:PqqD family peptide modification chaperone [Saccharothrix deserti]
MQRARNVAVTITREGYLELKSTETDEHYRGHPVAAAMWIALQQHDGQVDRAAAELADTWEIDYEQIRAYMDAWVNRLVSTGFMREENDISG